MSDPSEQTMRRAVYVVTDGFNDPEVSDEEYGNAQKALTDNAQAWVSHLLNDLAAERVRADRLQIERDEHADQRHRAEDLYLLREAERDAARVRADTAERQRDDFVALVREYHGPRSQHLTGCHFCDAIEAMERAAAPVPPETTRPANPADQETTDFYEEDEDPHEVRRAFEQGEKGITVRPGQPNGTTTFLDNYFVPDGGVVQNEQEPNE